MDEQDAGAVSDWPLNDLDSNTCAKFDDWFDEIWSPSIKEAYLTVHGSRLADQSAIRFLDDGERVRAKGAFPRGMPLSQATLNLGKTSPRLRMLFGEIVPEQSDDEK